VTIPSLVGKLSTVPPRIETKNASNRELCDGAHKEFCDWDVLQHSQGTRIKTKKATGNCATQGVLQHSQGALQGKLNYAMISKGTVNQCQKGKSVIFPWLESTLRGGEANFPFDIGSKRDF
jgi:hypothetical protein